MHIFNPKMAITHLADDKIDAKLIILLIVIFVLISVLSLFGFGGSGLEIIKESIKPLENIPSQQRLPVILRIVIDTSVLFLFYIIIYSLIVIVLSWVLKKILNIFKRDIRLFKLLNIFIYTILFNRFFLLVMSIIIHGLYTWVKSISESQFEIIAISSLAIINISTVILYIYAIKISLKKKIIPINNLPSAN